jgi:hypothetical protein
MSTFVPAIVQPGGVLPLCDARLGDLYRYWLMIRPAPDLIPGREHLEPTEIPQVVLPWIWLADVHRNPLRFRYRLIGTGLVAAMGSDATGHWFEDVHPPFRQPGHYPEYVAAAENRKISLYRGPPIYSVTPDWNSLERLILPMARNGRDVDMLLGAVVVLPRL